MNYFHDSAFQAKATVRTMQHKKLQELLQYMARYSPFYQEMFAKNNIDISTVNTVADLQRFPVTVKEDLQQRNYDFLCVSRDKIIEYSSTSGTLGSPVTIALTENDLERLAFNEYSSFICADGSDKGI